jgi:hypothetical protein
VTIALHFVLFRTIRWRRQSEGHARKFDENKTPWAVA